MIDNLPLNWPNKENSPELEAYFKQFGKKYYFTAEEINELRDSMNQMYGEFLANTDFISPIDLSSPAPTLPGIYIPTQAGPYPNYGGIVVDLTNKISRIVWNGFVFRQQVIGVDISGKVDKTSIKSTISPINVVDPVNSKAVADYVKSNNLKFTIGNNLFNKNFSPIIGEKGGVNTLINASGVVGANTGWFTSNPIEWGSNTTIIAKKLKSYIQYDENGILTSNYYQSTGDDTNKIITKDVTAKFIQISNDNGESPTNMVNFGSTLLTFEQYQKKYVEGFFNPVIDVNSKVREMFISESYLPNSATYTDGLINSPFNITWVDGAIGTVTITRNTDNLATTVVATHIIGGITKTVTSVIARNADGNATNQTLTIV